MNNHIVAEVQMYKTEREVKALDKFWCGPRFVVTSDSTHQAMFNWALHAHTNLVP